MKRYTMPTVSSLLNTVWMIQEIGWCNLRSMSPLTYFEWYLNSYRMMRQGQWSSIPTTRDLTARTRIAQSSSIGFDTSSADLRKLNIRKKVGYTAISVIPSTSQPYDNDTTTRIYGPPANLFLPSHK